MWITLLSSIRYLVFFTVNNVQVQTYAPTVLQHPRIRMCPVPESGHYIRRELYVLFLQNSSDYSQRNPVINFSGTSSGADGTVVVDMECSSQCTNITATGINLEPPNNGTATFVCQNVDISQVCPSQYL